MTKKHPQPPKLTEKIKTIVCFGQKNYFSVVNHWCQECYLYDKCMGEVMKKEGIKWKPKYTKSWNAHAPSVGNTLFQPEDSIAYATSVIMIQDLRGLENDG